KKPVLEKLPLDPADYSLLFIGTPVWAGSYAPPLKTFFSLADLTDKKVAFFCCHGGGKGKTLQKMEKASEYREILGKTDFKDPVKEETEKAAAEARRWAKEIFEKAVTK
ncbi:NAD(P)H-dependent oxidoreductase, partial [candidate division WOR-3 bacterium]|nr:NAD(P)H-dependent oxidoreductase [candidate division WOR-3 bacterium]